MTTISRGSTPTSAGTGFVTEVYAAPGSNGDVAFNSVLKVSNNPNSNCSLKLILNVFLKQINPSVYSDILTRAIANANGNSLTPGFKVGLYPDTDNHPAIVKEWNNADWQKFVNGFTGQAMTWNKKFCLIPSDDFVLWDFVQGNGLRPGTRFRPNVVCEFAINVFAGSYAAHRTVEVVNLYVPNWPFRADDLTYNSDSTTPWQVSVTDLNNQTQNLNHLTVAHEIGHALGQDHIGQSKNLPHCQLAILWEKVLHQDSIPALYQGGSNSSVCYGQRATMGDASNIMGSGDQFSVVNAKPWLDRLADHCIFAMDTSKWTVSMNEVPPMSIVNLR